VLIYAQNDHAALPGHLQTVELLTLMHTVSYKISKTESETS